MFDGTNCIALDFLTTSKEIATKDKHPLTKTVNFINRI